MHIKCSSSILSPATTGSLIIYTLLLLPFPDSIFRGLHAPLPTLHALLLLLLLLHVL